MSSGEPVAGPVVYVSFAEPDRAWAEWVTWQLQDRGYQVRFEPWDVVAGSNATRWLHETLGTAQHVVPVLSNAYLEAPEIASQWQAAVASEPGPHLVPVKIEDCRPAGLLGGVRAIELAGRDEQECRRALFAGFDAVGKGHARPERPPPFPGAHPVRPRFPAAARPAPAPGAPAVPDDGERPARSGAAVGAAGEASPEASLPEPVSLAADLLGVHEAPASSEAGQAGDLGQPPRAASPRRSRQRLIFVAAAAATAAVLAVVSTAAFVVLADGGGEAAPPSMNATLQAVSSEDTDAFMPSAGRNEPDVTPPLEGGGAVGGEVPGLFGGTREEGSCDREAIAAYLLGHRDLLAAWAAVLGIAPGGVEAFLDGLTPVVLRTDTLVTNHGYADGRAVPFAAVLQAGTAVLVDASGRPVVKCSCGNPLTAPPAAPTLHYTGQRWPAFSEQAVFRVEPVEVAVEVFVLVDVRTGAEFTRARGSGGEDDRDFLAAADVDWRTTTYRSTCGGAAGGELLFDVRDGTGEAVAAGRRFTLTVQDSTAGELTGDRRGEAAVLLRCVPAGAGGGARTEVHVFRDGPNRIGVLVPPEADGPDPLPPGLFNGSPLDVRDAALLTGVDYGDPADANVPLVQRVLSWRWDGSRFAHQVDSSATAFAPGTPGVDVQPGSGAVTVTVTAPSGGGPVSRYDLAASNGEAASLDVPGTVTLPVADCALVSVTATAVGPGGSSPPATSGQARGCVPPSSVRNLRVETVGENLVYQYLVWDPPADLGGGPVEYVVVIYDTLTGDETRTQADTRVGLGGSGGQLQYSSITITAQNSAGPGPTVTFP